MELGTLVYLRQGGVTTDEQLAIVASPETLDLAQVSGNIVQPAALELERQQSKRGGISNPVLVYVLGCRVADERIQVVRAASLTRVTSEVEDMLLQSRASRRGDEDGALSAVQQLLTLRRGWHRSAAAAAPGCMPARLKLFTLFTDVRVGLITWPGGPPVDDDDASPRPAAKPTASAPSQRSPSDHTHKESRAAQVGELVTVTMPFAKEARAGVIVSLAVMEAAEVPYPVRARALDLLDSQRAGKAASASSASHLVYLFTTQAGATCAGVDDIILAAADAVRPLQSSGLQEPSRRASRDGNPARGTVATIEIQREAWMARGTDAPVDLFGSPTDVRVGLVTWPGGPAPPAAEPPSLPVARQLRMDTSPMMAALSPPPVAAGKRRRSEMSSMIGSIVWVRQSGSKGLPYWPAVIVNADLIERAGKPNSVVQFVRDLDVEAKNAWHAVYYFAGDSEGMYDVVRDIAPFQHDRPPQFVPVSLHEQEELQRGIEAAHKAQVLRKLWEQGRDGATPRVDVDDVYTRAALSKLIGHAAVGSSGALRVGGLCLNTFTAKRLKCHWPAIVVDRTILTRIHASTELLATYDELSRASSSHVCMWVDAGAHLALEAAVGVLPFEPSCEAPERPTGMDDHMYANLCASFEMATEAFMYQDAYLAGKDNRRAFVLVRDSHDDCISLAMTGWPNGFLDDGCSTAAHTPAAPSPMATVHAHSGAVRASPSLVIRSRSVLSPDEAFVSPVKSSSAAVDDADDKIVIPAQSDGHGLITSYSGVKRSRAAQVAAMFSPDDELVAPSTRGAAPALAHPRMQARGLTNIPAHTPDDPGHTAPRIAPTAAVGTSGYLLARATATAHPHAPMLKGPPVTSPEDMPVNRRRMLAPGLLHARSTRTDMLGELAADTPAEVPPSSARKRSRAAQTPQSLPESEKDAPAVVLVVESPPPTAAAVSPSPAPAQRVDDISLNFAWSPDVPYGDDAVRTEDASARDELYDACVQAVKPVRVPAAVTSPATVAPQPDVPSVAYSCAPTTMALARMRAGLPAGTWAAAHWAATYSNDRSAVVDAVLERMHVTCPTGQPVILTGVHGSGKSSFMLDVCEHAPALAVYLPCSRGYNVTAWYDVILTRMCAGMLAWVHARAVGTAGVTLGRTLRRLMASLMYTRATLACTCQQRCICGDMRIAGFAAAAAIARWAPESLRARDIFTEMYTAISGGSIINFEGYALDGDQVHHATLRDDVAESIRHIKCPDAGAFGREVSALAALCVLDVAVGAGALAPEHGYVTGRDATVPPGLVPLFGKSCHPWTRVCVHLVCDDADAMVQVDEQLVTRMAVLPGNTRTCTSVWFITSNPALLTTAMGGGMPVPTWVLVWDPPTKPHVAKMLSYWRPGNVTEAFFSIFIGLLDLIVGVEAGRDFREMLYWTVTLFPVYMAPVATGKAAITDTLSLRTHIYPYMLEARRSHLYLHNMDLQAVTRAIELQARGKGASAAATPATASIHQFGTASAATTRAEASPHGDGADSASTPTPAAAWLDGQDNASLVPRRERPADLDLSYYAKVMLCASFCASNNPASTDAMYFSRSATGRRSSNPSSEKARVNAKKRTMLHGPQAFSLERLMDLTVSLLHVLDSSSDPDHLEVPASGALYPQVPLLTYMRVLERVDKKLDMYRCIASYGTVVGVALNIKLDIGKFLDDPQV